MNYMPRKERAAAESGGTTLRDRLIDEMGQTHSAEAAGDVPQTAQMDGAGFEGASDAFQARPSERPRTKKSFLVIGAVMLVLSCVGISVMPAGSSPETGAEVESALEKGTSKKLAVGVRLASNDKDVSMEPTDYTIKGKSNGDTTKIYVWDYAGEDGDYVQVLVDGQPVSEEFMIVHKPREFEVPTNGKVQVKGIHDAGGGLTYAVHCDLNGQSYFNNAPEGVLNTYTIVGS